MKFYKGEKRRLTGTKLLINKMLSCIFQPLKCDQPLIELRVGVHFLVLFMVLVSGMGFSIEVKLMGMLSNSANLHNYYCGCIKG